MKVILIACLLFIMTGTLFAQNPIPFKGSNNKYGYKDSAGKEVVPLNYEYADDFYKGLALVKLLGKWGYVDQTGIEVVPPKFDYAFSFVNGRGSVRLGDREFYIDKTGKELN